MVVGGGGVLHMFTLTLISTQRWRNGFEARLNDPLPDSGTCRPFLSKGPATVLGLGGGILCFYEHTNMGWLFMKCINPLVRWRQHLFLVKVAVRMDGCV